MPPITKATVVAQGSFKFLWRTVETVKIQANSKYPRPLRQTVQTFVAQEGFQYH